MENDRDRRPTTMDCQDNISDKFVHDHPDLNASDHRGAQGKTAGLASLTR